MYDKIIGTIERIKRIKMIVQKKHRYKNRELAILVLRNAVKMKEFEMRWSLIFYLLLLFQAEDITLTIGQAFDLAYKKFLDSKGKELESQKQSLIMQKRIEILEHENKELKKRLAEVAKIKGDHDVQQYLKNNNVSTS